MNETASDIGNRPAYRKLPVPPSEGAPEEAPPATPETSHRHHTKDGQAIATAAQTPASVRQPPSPLIKRFECRPLYLWTQRLDEVDMAWTETAMRAAADKHVFRFDQVFDKEAVFITFGRPNVATVMPDGQGRRQQFSAKSLKRAPSKIAGDVRMGQTGFHVALAKPTDEMKSALRAAMEKHEGGRQWTCVNANMRVWEDAGFSCGPTPLSKILFPVQLMRRLTSHPLKFRGQPVDVRFVKTTPTDMEGYGLQVAMDVIGTPWRHLVRPRLIKHRLLKKRESDQRKRVAALPLQVRGKEATVSVHASRASMIGLGMRQIWGAHTLFQIRQQRVDLDKHLPKVLPAFPKGAPKLVDWIKQKILFRPVAIRAMRRLGAKTYDDVAQRASESKVYEMLPTDSKDFPSKFNLVITGPNDPKTPAAITVSPLRVRESRLGNLPTWILAKHVYVSNYSKDVRYAGECYKDQDGVIHITLDSGSYQPTEEEARGARDYLQAIFPNMKFVVDKRKSQS